MSAARCAATRRAEGRRARESCERKKTGRRNYLDAIIAAESSGRHRSAIAHIERYGSQHTDAIVPADQQAADKFLRRSRFAIGCATTPRPQFADGGDSALAPRSASLPAGCMPAPRRGRAAHPFSIAYVARDKLCREFVARYASAASRPSSPRPSCASLLADVNPRTARIARPACSRSKDSTRPRVLCCFPGNPLKDTSALRRWESASQPRRLWQTPPHRCHRLEAVIGRQFSYDTIAYL